MAVQPQEATLDNLIRETEETRLEAAVLEATGDELLDRARAVSYLVEVRVQQVAARKEQGPDAYR
jgi:hypothetical protein